MRYDNRNDHKVESWGAYVHVYAHGDEDARLDLNFFDGDRTLSQARELLTCLEGAIADADAQVAQVEDAPSDTILNSAEEAEWKRLEERLTSLRARTHVVEERHRKLFSRGFTRSLLQGKWRVESSGQDTRAVPADSDTERLLTRLAQEARVVRDWHDSIFIEGVKRGTGLAVNFDDGSISISLDFYTDDPKRIEEFREASHLDLDLSGWVEQRKAEVVANIDRQIADLQAKRKRYAEGS